MPTPHAALCDLLEDLFTPAELRLLVSRLRDGRKLQGALPEAASSTEVFVGQVVDALRRRGRIDLELFAALSEARPEEASRIRAVASEWGIELPEEGGNVRILHLSDLHARQSTGWDSQPILSRLVEAGRGVDVDVVALTGDIAFSGKKEEYDLARGWLQDELLPALSGKRDLLVVPGNHDIDRDQCDTVSVRGLEAMLKDQAAVAEVLGDPKQNRSIFDRYEAYLQFLDDLGVAHARAPSWSWTKGDVLFAGLDTAWMASSDERSDRLVLGLHQVNTTLEGHDKAGVVVALAHHPLSSLVEWDREEVTDPLQARVDVLLRGHLHRPRPAWGESFGHRLVELPAGAAYAGSRYSNSFQLVELSSDEVCARVCTWVPERDAWVPDSTRFPPDGRVCYPLEAGGTPLREGGGGGTHYDGDVAQVVNIDGHGHTIHISGPGKG